MNIIIGEVYVHKNTGSKFIPVEVIGDFAYFVREADFEPEKEGMYSYKASGVSIYVFHAGRLILFKELPTTKMCCGVTVCCGYDFGVDAFCSNKPNYCPCCGKYISEIIKEV